MLHNKIKIRYVNKIKINRGGGCIIVKWILNFLFHMVYSPSV